MTIPEENEVTYRQYDDKMANAEKYAKTHSVANGKRKNAKEERRREHLIRLSRKKREQKKRNLKVHSNEAQFEDASSSGHSGPSLVARNDDLFNDDYYDELPTTTPVFDTPDPVDSIPALPARSPLQRERNEMARICVNTGQFDDSSQDVSVLSAMAEIERDAAEMPAETQEQVDTWLGHAENLLIFAFQVQRSKNFMDVFAATVAYIKMYIKSKSVVYQLYSVINSMPETEPEADELSVQGWSDDFVDKWDLFKNHAIFKRISYLISAALSITVSSMKEITWSPYGLQVIHITALKEQVKAFDLIDAVVKTFKWMVDCGYQCIKERSLAPFLYSDVKNREFVSLTDNIFAHSSAALAGNTDDLGKFEQDLDEALRLVVQLKKAKSDGSTSFWLQTKYEKLIDIKQRLISKRKNTTIRFAPIGWSISGSTGVGKTSVAKATMITSLSAMDFSYEESRIITLDTTDKYQSTYTSDINGMYIDDVSNQAANFVPSGETPCAKMIKFFNNVSAQAIKADIQDKGVVFIDFKCGIVTTNVKDLDAHVYSNCPESILRRFHHVIVEVKDEYRLPGSVSLDPAHQDILNDSKMKLNLWKITIQEVVVYTAQNGRNAFYFEDLVVNMNGRRMPCKDLSIQDYLLVVAALSKKHKITQEGVVKKATFLKDIGTCPNCKVVNNYCQCVSNQSLEMIGDVIVDAAQKSVKSYFNSWFAPVKWFNSLLGYSPIKKMATKQLAKELGHDLNRFLTPWAIALVPDFVFQSRYFQGAVDCWQTSASMFRLQKYFSALAFSTFCGLSYFGYKKNTTGLLGTSVLSTVGGCTLYAGYCSRKAQIRQEYAVRRDALPQYVRSLRDGCAPKLALMSATLILGVKLLSMWNNRRMETHGLDPESINSSPGWFDQWFGTQHKHVASDNINNVVTSDAAKALTKVIWWCDFTRSDGSRAGCNVVALQNGFIMFPEHMFYPKGDMTKTPSEVLKCRVRRDYSGSSSFSFIAERNHHSYLFPDKDLRMVFVANMPDSKSTWKFLPKGRPQGSYVSYFMSRDSTGSLDQIAIHTTMGDVKHPHMKLYGGHYICPKSVDGACTSIVLSDTVKPVILGFHICGNEQSQYGVMQNVTMEEYLCAVTTLSKEPGVALMAQSVELPKNQMGKPVMISEKVHPNAKFIHSLDENAEIDVLGSTAARTVQKSEVTKSVISDSVKEVTGVENDWGPPALDPNWEAYNATLEKVVDPSSVFPPSALERARQDWLKPLMPLMDSHRVKDDFRPLTFKESINGVDGKRFLDPLIMKTSMGFPVFGKKSKYFQEVRDGEKLIDRVPDPKVVAEYDRMIAAWEKGERAYPVCSATLKDEPTRRGKKKVRVFQAAPVAMSLAIRKYFLPIARFLGLHPIDSECAVGINAFSPDWEELMKHTTKYMKKKRVIAWDYSKYDVRMNSQMTTAVLKSYIDLARQGGYDEESLKIMEAMIIDIVHPLLDWNGTLLMAFHMNTSGNNITVNINSTANSFYVRMGFFFVYPNEKDFRRCVAIMTYGDDCEGSVAQNYELFNFVSYRDFLADHGMKITHPDKSDCDSPFLDVDKADFLKRVSSEVEGLPCVIGKLSEESIFKSLHANLKSQSATPREVSMSCMETALHEWFAYGKEHYEMRLSQMKEVALRSNLPQTPAFCSFEDRVEMWREKYL